LLDSVSHELKTPLSVLRSAAEKLDTDDLRMRKSLTREVSLATHRLDQLVANLLSQSRLESGGLSPQLDWCDARDLVSAARRGVEAALMGRAIKIDIPTEMPLFMADAPLMEQVLSNLLLNAAVHTPKESSIRVNAGLENTSQRVFIMIEDTGPGIPPELRATLFQKFHRGNAARDGGLGLGLEGGACFTLYLPYLPHGLVPNDER
jgi:two-component system sensor histidine kinase KdpD